MKIEKEERIPDPESGAGEELEAGLSSWALL